MKKIIIGLCLMALLISCERIVDFPGAEHGRIYVNAIIGHTGQDWINVNVSKPAFGSESAKAEDVVLCLEADGQPVALERYMDHSPAYEGEICYLITERLLPGQNLKLTAQTENLPQVQAVTSVPETLENVDISTRLAVVDKIESGSGFISYLKTLREFKISIDAEHEKEEFFGIQIRKKTVIDSLGNVPDDRWNVYKEYHGVIQYESFFVNLKHEEINISSVDMEMVTYFEGGQMRVMESTKEADMNTVTVYIEPYYRHLLSGSYTNNIMDWEIHEDYEYNVKVCRISPEMYYCMRAEYIKNHSNPPVYLGFGSASYIYTNVEGGLGMFGAMSSYDTGWFRID